MTTKNICPATLAEGYDGYSPIAIKYLFNGHKATPEITFPWPEERESVPAMLVRGNMRICRRQQQPGYVLEKFVSGPHNERIPIAANKHLTMQIASQVFHIQTIQNGLCFTRDGEPLFVTQYGQTKSYRGRKVKDVATIMNISEDQPLYSSISWQEVASVIRQIAPAWPVALERFFVTLVFNYIYCNESCGLRSIALYEPHPGDYQIAPARHLVNTAIIPALPSEETHDFALQFDSDVMIEKGVDHAREIFCALYGEGANVKASACGELRMIAGEFFDYNAKYIVEGGCETKVPADIPTDTAAKMRADSMAVFHALNGSGLARADFLMDKDGTYYFSEINTLPGMSETSLFPQLFEACGESYPQILDGLIEQAQAVYERKKALSLNR